MTYHPRPLPEAAQCAGNVCGNIRAENVMVWVQDLGHPREILIVGPAT